MKRCPRSMEPLLPQRPHGGAFHLQTGLAALPRERGLLPNALPPRGACGVAGGPWCVCSCHLGSRRPATAPACPKGCYNGFASADQQAVGALPTALGGLAGLLPQRGPRRLVKGNGQHIALQAKQA